MSLMILFEGIRGVVNVLSLVEYVNYTTQACIPFLSYLI